MSEMSFIKEETHTSTSDLIRLNWRLFKSLPLFLKLLPLTILSILLASAAPSVFRWYAGNYSKYPLSHSENNSGDRFTLEGLVLIVCLAILSRIAAWVFFEVSGMWSAQGIYSQMIRGLSRTRTTFFDENPSGRVINRLVRDYDELRSTAIIFAGDCFNASVEILSIAVIASLSSPWAGVVVIPLLAIFLLIQSWRSILIEKCRALSAIATSNVINRKNDLIEGRDIFILYGKSDHLLERMKESLRSYLQSSILTSQVDAWASFLIRFCAEIFAFLVLLFTIFALYHRRIDITIAGVVISALFGITGSIGWLDFASSLVSRSVPHLRRVFEFIDLPEESSEELSLRVQIKPARLNNSSRLEESGLPKLGDIVFENYSMSYRKGLPLILSDLNLTVRQGKKTALIGRTGSGKSSIMQALLRMVYVHQGDIRIGETSIFQLEIQQLRRQFGVVPQFPYLFKGTLRMNLDRTGQITDKKLISTLDDVGLKYSLQCQVDEGGANFSVGERQLICLARVIASDRSIILMDEPTSGLDPLTDARIHSILKTSLNKRTVLTIAHRMESLKGYDAIIELKGGKVNI